MSNHYEAFKRGEIGTQVLTKDFITRTVKDAISEAMKRGPVCLIDDSQQNRLQRGKRRFSLRYSLEQVAVNLLKEDLQREFVGDRISHITVFVDGSCSVGVDEIITG